jgi:hypothetical protein
MVMSGKRQRPAPRSKIVPPEIIAEVRRAGTEQSVSRVQRAIGVLGSGYYAAMSGLPVSEATCQKFERWYASRSAQPRTGEASR